MSSKRKWILGFAIAFALLVPIAVYATVTVSGGLTHTMHNVQPFTLSAHFSGTDSSKVITLPERRGCPDFILWQQAKDNANAGRAKTAMQNGEVINFAPNEYEGASLSGGQLTIYRTDLDGNDTLTSDVWFEFTFGWLHHQDY